MPHGGKTYEGPSDYVRVGWKFGSKPEIEKSLFVGKIVFNVSHLIGRNTLKKIPPTFYRFLISDLLPNSQPNLT